MEVYADVRQQIAGGEKRLLAMVESHLRKETRSLESGQPPTYVRATTTPAAAGR